MLTVVIWGQRRQEEGLQAFFPLPFDFIYIFKFYSKANEYSLGNETMLNRLKCECSWASLHMVLLERLWLDPWQSTLKRKEWTITRVPTLLLCHLCWSHHVDFSVAKNCSWIRRNSQGCSAQARDGRVQMSTKHRLRIRAKLGRLPFQRLISRYPSMSSCQERGSEKTLLISCPEAMGMQRQRFCTV